MIFIVWFQHENRFYFTICMPSPKFFGRATVKFSNLRGGLNSPFLEKRYISIISKNNKTKYIYIYIISYHGQVPLLSFFRPDFTKVISNFCKISHFYTTAQNMIVFIKISFSKIAISLMIKIYPLYTLILICNWLFCPLKTFSLWSFIFWSQKRYTRTFLTSKNLRVSLFWWLLSVRFKY